MESLLPSEIARLVLGYLLEERDCETAAQMFLEKSDHLRECLLMAKRGRKFETAVAGNSLDDILEDYCAINSAIAEQDQDFLDSLPKTGGTATRVQHILHLAQSNQSSALNDSASTASSVVTPQNTSTGKRRKRSSFPWLQEPPSHVKESCSPVSDQVALDNVTNQQDKVALDNVTNQRLAAGTEAGIVNVSASRLGDQVALDNVTNQRLAAGKEAGIVNVSASRLGDEVALDNVTNQRLAAGIVNVSASRLGDQVALDNVTNQRLASAIVVTIEDPSDRPPHSRVNGSVGSDLVEKTTECNESVSCSLDPCVGQAAEEHTFSLPAIVLPRGKSSASPAKNTPVKLLPSSSPMTRQPTLVAAPVTAAPVTAAPVTATLVIATPVKATLINASLVKATPVKATPVKTTPVKATPVKATPVKTTPVKTTPVRATPIKATPVKATPVKATPVKATPVKATPVRATAAKATPINTSPVKATPVDATPVKATPVKAPPLEATPVGATPVKAALNSVPPRKATPRKTTPCKTTGARNKALSDEDDSSSLDFSIFTNVLENSELHQHLASHINQVIRGDEPPRPPDQPFFDHMADELSLAIKTIVSQTEQDPFFDRLLDDIIGPADEEVTRSESDLPAPPAPKSRRSRDKEARASRDLPYKRRLRSATKPAELVPTLEDQNNAAVEYILGAGGDDPPTDQATLPGMTPLTYTEIVNQATVGEVIFEGDVSLYEGAAPVSVPPLSRQIFNQSSVTILRPLDTEGVGLQSLFVNAGATVANFQPNGYHLSSNYSPPPPVLKSRYDTHGFVKILPKPVPPPRRVRPSPVKLPAPCPPPPPVNRHDPTVAALRVASKPLTKAQKAKLARKERQARRKQAPPTAGLPLIDTPLKADDLPQLNEKPSTSTFVNKTKPKPNLVGRQKSEELNLSKSSTESANISVDDAEEASSLQRLSADTPAPLQVNDPAKRVSHSTPRRSKPHIRALDFSTPPKHRNPQRRARTSPKGSARKSPRSLLKGLKLRSPPGKKVRSILFTSPQGKLGAIQETEPADTAQGKLEATAPCAGPPDVQVTEAVVTPTLPLAQDEPQAVVQGQQQQVEAGAPNVGPPTLPQAVDIQAQNKPDAAAPCVGPPTLPQAVDIQAQNKLDAAAPYVGPPVFINATLVEADHPAWSAPIATRTPRKQLQGDWDGVTGVGMILGKSWDAKLRALLPDAPAAAPKRAVAPKRAAPKKPDRARRKKGGDAEGESSDEEVSPVRRGRVMRSTVKQKVDKMVVQSPTKLRGMKRTLVPQTSDGNISVTVREKEPALLNTPVKLPVTPGLPSPTEVPETPLTKLIRTDLSAYVSVPSPVTMFPPTPCLPQSAASPRPLTPSSCHSPGSSYYRPDESPPKTSTSENNVTIVETGSPKTPPVPRLDGRPSEGCSRVLVIQRKSKKKLISHLSVEEMIKLQMEAVKKEIMFEMKRDSSSDSSSSSSSGSSSSDGETSSEGGCPTPTKAKRKKTPSKSPRLKTPRKSPTPKKRNVAVYTDSDDDRAEKPDAESSKRDGKTQTETVAGKQPKRRQGVAPKDPAGGNELEEKRLRILGKLKSPELAAKKTSTASKAVRQNSAFLSRNVPDKSSDAARKAARIMQQLAAKTKRVFSPKKTLSVIADQLREQKGAELGSTTEDDRSVADLVIDESRLDQSAASSLPQKQDQSAASSLPQRPDESVSSSGPQRLDQSVASSQPQRLDQSAACSGPQRLDQSVASSLPQKLDQSVASSLPQKLDQSVASSLLQKVLAGETKTTHPRTATKVSHTVREVSKTGSGAQKIAESKPRDCSEARRKDPCTFLNLLKNNDKDLARTKADVASPACSERTENSEDLQLRLSSSEDENLKSVARHSYENTFDVETDMRSSTPLLNEVPKITRRVISDREVFVEIVYKYDGPARGTIAEPVDLVAYSLPLIVELPDGTEKETVNTVTPYREMFSVNLPGESTRHGRDRATLNGRRALEEKESVSPLSNLYDERRERRGERKRSQLATRQASRSKYAEEEVATDDDLMTYALMGSPHKEASLPPKKRRAAVDETSAAEKRARMNDPKELLNSFGLDRFLSVLHGEEKK